MIYQFKAGSHLYGDAQPVGERLEQIRSSSAGLTPEAVLADAASKGSALHPYFEWNDKRAAHKYRTFQASHLIRSVTVQIEEPVTPQREISGAVAEPRATSFRAFLPVQRPDGERVFESTAKALSDADYRKQVLVRAHGELGAVARKYRELQELSDVIGAIDRVGELLTLERSLEAE